MLQTPLPGTSLNPSVVCLGVGGFGSATPLDESLALLDAYAEAGGNCADTAHVYASWLPGGEGQSERTLGHWLRSRQPQGFIVGTKGGHPDLETMEVSRLSPECIRRDLEESLERLQADNVALYWLHRDDTSVPVAEIIDALNTLQSDGLIGALGASNWRPERIIQANNYAAENGLTGFCASQIGWSLAVVNDEMRGWGGTIQMDEPTLEWHRHSGFPVMAYSSQANGFFATPLPEPGTSLSPKQQALAPTYHSAENSARYARAVQLGEAMGRDANEIALSYIWSQVFPSIAIIGSRTLGQLENSLRAADLRLSAEEISFLEGDNMV